MSLTLALIVVALILGVIAGYGAYRETEHWYWGLFTCLLVVILAWGLLIYLIPPTLKTFSPAPIAVVPSAEVHPTLPMPLVQPTPIPTLVSPTLVPPNTALVSSSYPLAGQSYSSPQGSEYNAVWTVDGRLWQPKLPSGAERIAHSVAITIEEGLYAFDGVECQLFVDSSRNGAGASNPVTVEYGNDLRFSVSTADHGQAWALVQCRGNASSGFQIRWLGQ